MIISVSRRTDIPAFYSKWFFNRIKEGFVDVVNPFNPRQVKRVDLSPRAVDCIVFWTKNPAPMMPKLSLLSKYDYYFHFTLNPYGKDIEPNLPSKVNRIKSFKSLSKYLGKERVVWRYDPIIVTEKYNIDYHIKSFEEMADGLAPHTCKCVISFVDIYQKNFKALEAIGARSLLEKDMRVLVCAMARTACKHKLELASCSEKIDLKKWGVEPGRCIDDKLIGNICGRSINIEKDKGQRPWCGCIKSIDIGRYQTCPHGCVYCYANSDPARGRKNFALHDAGLPVL